MTATIPISELKQRTSDVLATAVVGRQDVIIERYGKEYAVVLSLARYRELVDAAQARVRTRFMESRQAVYTATAEIPENELDEIVAESILESREAKANDAGGA
jgi:prevent-host-death family protein